MKRNTGTHRREAHSSKEDKPEELTQGLPIVLVLGDICIDWLFFEFHPDALPNRKGEESRTTKLKRWEESRVVTVAMHSGAWLMETFVKALLCNIYSDRIKQLRHSGAIESESTDSAKEHERNDFENPPFLADRVYCYYRFQPTTILRAADPKFLVHSSTNFAILPRNPTNKKDSATEAPATAYRTRTHPQYWGPSYADLVEENNSKAAVGKPAHPMFPQLSIDPSLTTTDPIALEQKYQVNKRGFVDNIITSFSESFSPDTEKATPQSPTDALTDRWPHVRKAFLEYPTPYPKDAPKIVLIHDSGDGFLDLKRNWAHVFEDRPFNIHEYDSHTASAGNASQVDNWPIIVLYIHSLTNWGADGRYRKNEGIAAYFLQHERLWEHTIVVLSADTLRKANLLISKSLSWEQTAADLVKAVRRNEMSELLPCRHLIVRFGLSGVIHCHWPPARWGGNLTAKMWYDPLHIEGEYRDRSKEGDMNGLTMLLAATVTAFLTTELCAAGKDNVAQPVSRDEKILKAIQKGCQQGIANCRRYHREGFRHAKTRQELVTGIAEWDNLNAFSREEAVKGLLGPVDLYALQEDVEDYLGTEIPPKENWTILGESTRGYQAEELFIKAEQIVRFGLFDPRRNLLRLHDWADFPVLHLGELVTADCREIERFRSVRNLLHEYAQRQRVNRPLCLAVFGPPGSGKSFGVKEIAKAVTNGKMEPLEYNLSQFTTPEDLTHVLIKARDVALGNEVPLIFFDEFDCDLNNVGLGWLKFFLSVMQDGKFKHRDGLLNLGKAVFVFAGGISRTYKEFCRSDKTGLGEVAAFKAAKGPDFVSRLRGFVDIIGPDRSLVGTGLSPEEDPVFLIRRAIILRRLLERGYQHLLKITGKNPIERDVLRALLKVPSYKHGARSMEAILEMSALASAMQFEKSCIPPKEQLETHVDADRFLDLVTKSN